jgi:sensor histidine kinase regulating citrate/malate metabolism
MDIKTRKIELIRGFLNLQSEDAISRVEKLISKETKAQKSIKPFDIQKFNERIDASMQDSKNGKLIESEDLLKEIEGWV